MVVRSEASWKVSRSPLATSTVPPRFLPRGRRREKVVRLVAGRLCVDKTACADEFGQDVELIEQRVVKLPAALICWKLLVPFRRYVQRVPGDKDRSRLLRLIKAQEKVGEAHDRAAAFTILPQNGLGQRLIRAMCEGVSIDDKKGTCAGG
jgi:hypothetical protein